MPVFRDKFVLGQSEKKELAGIAETIRLDLTLHRNPFFNSGSLTGKIKDVSGNGIPRATILILDENNEAIAAATAGNDGIYFVPRLKPGSGYRACSLAPGFRLSDTVFFDMEPNQLLEKDIVLKPDMDESWSIIAGIVQNAYGMPVSTASVELCQVEGNEAKLTGLTFTNDIGHFVIRVKEIGTYLLKINAAGFFTENIPAEIKRQKSIVSISAVLREDLKASKGIVTGIISNDEDEPLPDADVILYRTGAGNTLVPVAYTRTNHEGIYLFVNVPPGEYMVNANRPVTVG